MTDLSPAAQAVLDAAVLPCTIRQGIAAAIRALANQVVPEEPGFDPLETLSPDYWNQMNAKKCQREESRRQLLAIAAELEGNQ